MNIVPSLSTPLYEFHCDPALIDEILPEIKKMTFISDSTPAKTSISKEFFYNKKLVDWFEDCLEEVRKLYFIDTIKLNVTTCWATKTNWLSKHQVHKHQQSVVSGILYLQDDVHGQTVFIQDSPWTYYIQHNFMNIVDRKGNIPNLETTIEQKKGKLILYPSHILHGTLVNKSKHNRYSIAFDSFFSGKIFDNSQWPYFEIKTTTITDIANQKRT